MATIWRESALLLALLLLGAWGAAQHTTVATIWRESALLLALLLLGAWGAAQHTTVATIWRESALLLALLLLGAWGAAQHTTVATIWQSAAWGTRLGALLTLTAATVCIVSTPKHFPHARRFAEYRLRRGLHRTHFNQPVIVQTQGSLGPHLSPLRHAQ